MRSGARCLDGLQRVEPSADGTHVEPLEDEPSFERGRDRRIVVDHQDLGLLHPTIVLRLAPQDLRSTHGVSVGRGHEEIVRRGMPGADGRFGLT